MSITVHLLCETDLDATDAVVMAAYNVATSRKSSLRLYMALQPDGAYVAKDGDTIVGFGAALNYGPFAYIGLMSVHPSMQKRGIGHAILERLLTWLEEQHCPTALLDATPVGAPLYEQYGFITDDITMVMRLEQPERQPLSIENFSYSHMSSLREQDVESLITFDASYFGARREAVLMHYIQPGRVFVTKNERGHITGYIVAQSHTIGPWVAQTGEDAAQLFYAALALPFEDRPGVFVSAHNDNALALLYHWGFVEQRNLKHMYRGIHVIRERRDALYGQVSLGLG